MNRDMHEWLSSGSAEESLRPDRLETIADRAASLKRRRTGTRAVLSIVAIVAIAATVVAVPRLTPEKLNQRAAGLGPAGAALFPGVLTEEQLVGQSAVTALRAIDAAELRNSLGVYFDYEDATLREDVWTVSFAAYDCSDVECPDMGGPNEVDVTFDGPEMEVISARGNFTPAQRETVVGFRNAVSDATGFEASSISISDARGVETVFASYLWLGPMPQADDNLGTECEIEFVSEDGASKQHAFWLPAPLVEGARDHVGRTVAPADFNASSASISCGQPIERDPERADSAK